MNRKDNQKFDVVVVGTGNAALCSAIAAKENGVNVLVLERGPKEKRGGNSFLQMEQYVLLIKTNMR